MPTRISVGSESSFATVLASPSASPSSRPPSFIALSSRLSPRRVLSRSRLLLTLWSQFCVLPSTTTTAEMISPPPSPSFLLFPHLSPTPDPISFTLDSHLSKQTFPALARRTPQPFNDELEPQPRFSFDRRTSPSPSLNPSTSSLNSDSEPIPSLQRAHIGSKFGSSARSDSSAASTSPTSVAPVSIFEVVQKKRSIMEEPEIILSLDLCKFHAEDRLPQDPFWRPRLVALSACVFCLLLRLSNATRSSY